MAAERLSMRKIKEVLRLQAAGRSTRGISQSTGIARSTVSEYLVRAHAANLSWPLPDHLTDSAVEDLLFPPAVAVLKKPLPDWKAVHDEMKGRRRTGVTLQLLWIEYREATPEGRSTASSARTTGSGVDASILCCDRSTRAVKRCLSISLRRPAMLTSRFGSS